jgi:tRNA (cytidine56-2'-O)-methyltransferase
MITVLRLAHRIERDKRITTHCALVARALGAGRILYSGEKDGNLESSVKKVVGNWGGPFGIKHTKNYKKEIRGFMGTKVHLTVYGIPFEKKIATLRKKKNIMVIVGGGKVPPEVYHMADYNLSVSSQPHSEVAALAVFMDRYFKGRELGKRFKKARLEVIPQERGKKVVKHGH